MYQQIAEGVSATIFIPVPDLLSLVFFPPKVNKLASAPHSLSPACSTTQPVQLSSHRGKSLALPARADVYFLQEILVPVWLLISGVNYGSVGFFSEVGWAYHIISVLFL